MANRHQFRANWHDYNGGIYFVTICCAEKKHYLGKIISHEMQLSEIGNIAKATIEGFTKHFTNDELWNYVIMPNHIHLVVAVGTRHGASALTSPEESPNLGCLKPKRHDAPALQDYHHNNRLGVIIGQIKSTIKREANRRAITFKWQTRFYEHIIRNQRAYDNIMNYIDSNVENWGYDTYNANRIDNADAPWRVPTNDHDHEA